MDEDENVVGDEVQLNEQIPFEEDLDNNQE